MNGANVDMFERAAQAGRISWSDPNIDLSIRRKLLGEATPYPYFDLPRVTAELKNTRNEAIERGNPIEVDENLLAFTGFVLFSGKANQGVINNVNNHAGFMEQNERLMARHRTATPEQRVLIWLRDKGRCVHCEGAVQPGGKMSIGTFTRMEVDHHIPWFDGGMTSAENLFCSCQYCNVLKGRKSPEEFIAYKAETNQSQQTEDYYDQYTALGRR